MPEQTRDEQMSRVEQDEYAERVLLYLAGRIETTALEVYEAVFVSRDDVGRPLGRHIMEQRDALRIGKVFRQLEWYPIQSKRDGRKVNLWRPILKRRD